MIDPIYKLKKVCTEQRKDLSGHLAGGGVNDYNAYCKAVGAIQTLDMVLSEIEELEKNAVEE
jgi:hypothetical protein